jgi:hypothetical protein
VNDQFKFIRESRFDIESFWCVQRRIAFVVLMQSGLSTKGWSKWSFAIFGRLKAFKILLRHGGARYLELPQVTTNEPHPMNIPTSKLDTHARAQNASRVSSPVRHGDLRCDRRSNEDDHSNPDEPANDPYRTPPPVQAIEPVSIAPEHPQQPDADQSRRALLSDPLKMNSFDPSRRSRHFPRRLLRRGGARTLWRLRCMTS